MFIGTSGSRASRRAQGDAVRFVLGGLLLFVVIVAVASRGLGIVGTETTGTYVGPGAAAPIAGTSTALVAVVIGFFVVAGAVAFRALGNFGGR